MNSAMFRFYDDINFFISKENQNNDISYNFEGNPSIKDCIEAIGVPHTEIEAVSINNIYSDLNQKINDKDYVKVYSYNSNIDFYQIVKLRPDIKEYKFIVDANVGKVAKNLIMFGFDTHYDFDLPDKEIVNLAEREERIILSRDWGLLKRKNSIFGYYPRKTNTDEQLAEIIKRYNLYDKFKPLSLCLECNGQIVKVEKSEAKEHLDEGVLKDYNDFYKCKTCQKYFWKGSHYDKMLETIDKWKKHV
jgi:uncharacterized protein with PIN domain